jgi:hypothetical protein
VILAGGKTILPARAAPSPTVNPICSGNLGPHGGYTTSQLSGLIGILPIVIVGSSIASVVPVSTDPANLSNTESSITGYSRPEILPGCKLEANQSKTQWFNPACYVSPASLLVGLGYGFGTSGIGNLRDQWLSDWDASLIKNFKFSEAKSLQFRFEAF